MKNRLLNVTTYIFLLTLCFSCRKEKGVITKEYYSNGNLKYIEYFEGQDTFPMIAKSYYSDGSLHTSCYVDRNGTCNGMYVTYYQDGRLQDSCEFYNGVCIRQLCNEFPNKSNCFIMIQGNNDNERLSLYQGHLRFIFQHFSMDCHIIRVICITNIKKINSISQLYLMKTMQITRSLFLHQNNQIH